MTPSDAANMATTVTGTSFDDHFAHPPLTNVNEAQPTDWLHSILILWSLGVAFWLVRMIIGLRCVAKFVRQSRDAPSAVQSEFEQVAEERTVGSIPNLRVSAAVAGPLLCGIFRPTLVIPKHMTDSSRADQLPAVFAHELAHLQSRDLLWNLLLNITGAVLWFHPLVWLVRRSHAAACESVSDAEAAGFVGNVQSYGRTLAQVALDAAVPPTFTMAMARTSDVRRRIETLERKLFIDRLPRQIVCTAVVIGLLSVALIGSFKSTIAAEPAPTSNKPNEQRKDRSAAADETDALNKAAPVRAAQDDSARNLITPETEAAIKRGLEFLVRQQKPNGSFGNASGPNSAAITGLCGLALLHSGSKPGEGPHGEPIQKAVDYLLSVVQDNGFIGKSSFYVHAYALRFLAEAQRVKKSEKATAVVQNAVNLLVKSQNETNGWRYAPNSRDADSSISACILIALQAAKRAGADVPQDTVDRAVKYLKSCQTNDGGFAYISGGPNMSALPRSAAVIAALYDSGVDDEVTARAFKYFKARGTPNAAANFYAYTQLHLASALRGSDKATFRDWYDLSRDQLLKDQKDAGNWTKFRQETEYITACLCIALQSARGSATK